MSEKNGNSCEWTCRYCDLGAGPTSYDSDQVCSGCGSDWSECKLINDNGKNEEELEWPTYSA